MTHTQHPGGPSDLSATLSALVEAGPTVRELVDAYIAATVEACGGNKRRAAKRLGLSHMTVYTRMNAMELAAIAK